MFNKDKKWTIYLFYNGYCIKKLKKDGKEQRKNGRIKKQMEINHCILYN